MATNDAESHSSAISPRASALAMLDKMSVPELAALIEAAETKRRQKLEVAKEELLTEFRAKASSLGLPPESLFPPQTMKASARRPRSDVGEKRRPKFRGPDGEEWSGRGRAPSWLTTLEAQGRKRDEFTVKGDQA